MGAVAWDRAVDVVVVGSGAAGLTAAVVAADGGCAVEVLEKAELVGGTSAFSGGMVWIPLNHHQAGAGVEDDRAAAIDYIKGLTQGREPDPELIEVFVDRAAEAVAYIEAHTGVRLQIARSWSDYYADRPGGVLFGRSLDNAPIAVRELLGDWYDRMRRGPHMPATLTEDEVATFGHNPDPRGHSEDGIDFAALAQERGVAGIATMGQALVAGLLQGAVERDAITITTSAPVRRLVVEDGAVVGVVASGPEGEVAIRARRGVLLASGGFEWNAELVQAFLGVSEIVPMSPPGNEGDGLLMAMELGARLANMTMGWGLPVTYDGTSTLDGRPLGNPNVPRHQPGAIMINRMGRRFVNEGISYQEFQKVFRTFDPVTQSYPNQAPVWAVFDARVRAHVYSGDFVPDAPAPAWVKESPTLAGLAAEIGVDPDVLVAEVERWNANVAGGSDPDFGRGTVWTEGWTTGGPSAADALAPIGDGPYYAMPVHDGYLGTSGGVALDPDGRVRAARGGVIAGLYGAGNVAASIFGPAYPGGGSSLCQGVTFGYLAARHMSNHTTTKERT
jgi:succinate dehydrogenase/fumarate reductase flavoprotein subunit